MTECLGLYTVNRPEMIHRNGMSGMLAVTHRNGMQCMRAG